MILSELIRARLHTQQRTVQPLRGGLHLVFYPQNGTYSRIVATRRGVEPSDRELATLRREIETAVDDRLLVTVGNFERLEPKDGYHAAQIWINFAPMPQ